MCGRYTLSPSPEEVARLFEVAGFVPFPPRYNIAPTQPIGVVRLIGGTRRLELVRWGLVPGWVKDPRSFKLLINARAETAAEKPAFRAAMRHRRCLVPASGFYEWRRLPDGKKQPYFIRPRDGRLLAFGGLVEEWIDCDGGILESAAILTTAANAAVAPIYERMPVIVAPEDFERWLDCLRNEPRTVAELMRPAPDDLLEAIPVSTRVNAARNDDAGLVEPLSEAATTAPAPD
jgi:putative SOS response-associated peptidase YedK